MDKEYFLGLRADIKRNGEEVDDLELCLTKLAIVMGNDEVKEQIKREVYSIAQKSINGHKNTIRRVEGITLLDPVSSLREEGIIIDSKYLSKLFMLKTQRLNKSYVHGAFIPKPPSLIEED